MSGCHFYPGAAVVVALLTLTLGIGANTAVFTVVNAHCSPRCFTQPDRIVIINQTAATAERLGDARPTTTTGALARIVFGVGAFRPASAASRQR